MQLQHATSTGTSSFSLTAPARLVLRNAEGMPGAPTTARHEAVSLTPENYLTAERVQALDTSLRSLRTVDVTEVTKTPAGLKVTFERDHETYEVTIAIGLEQTGQTYRLDATILKNGRRFSTRNRTGLGFGQVEHSLTATLVMPFIDEDDTL